MSETQKFQPSNHQAFSDSYLKQALIKGARREKRHLLRPLLEFIYRNMSIFSPDQLASEIEHYLTISNEISCKTKPSFTMEDAGNATQFKNPVLSPYICRTCGYIHFGHTPKILEMLPN